jgi:hypothetical protein
MVKDTINAKDELEDRGLLTLSVKGKLFERGERKATARRRHRPRGPSYQR